MTLLGPGLSGPTSPGGACGPSQASAEGVARAGGGEASAPLSPWCLCCGDPPGEGRSLASPRRCPGIWGIRVPARAEHTPAVLPGAHPWALAAPGRGRGPSCPGHSGPLLWAVGCGLPARAPGVPGRSQEFPRGRAEAGSPAVWGICLRALGLLSGGVGGTPGGRDPLKAPHPRTAPADAQRALSQPSLQPWGTRLCSALNSPPRALVGGWAGGALCLCGHPNCTRRCITEGHACACEKLTPREPAAVTPEEPMETHGGLGAGNRARSACTVCVCVCMRAREHACEWA